MHTHGKEHHSTPVSYTHLDVYKRQVVARKSGDKWFIGAISGVDKEREITFNLPEECIGKKFTLIKDGKDINSFDYEEITSDDGKVTVKVLGNGGFAAII